MNQFLLFFGSDNKIQVSKPIDENINLPWSKVKDQKGVHKAPVGLAQTCRLKQDAGLVWKGREGHVQLCLQRYYNVQDEACVNTILTE